MYNLEYYKKVMYQLCERCKHFEPHSRTCEKRHNPAKLIEDFFTKANRKRICEDYERKED